MYGKLTEIKLEMHWIEARRGYAENERCTVVISPETMKTYYKSIYIGE